MAAAILSGMIDAAERVAGRIPYTLDVELPGMLQALLLRSTTPHARLRRVDVERARQVPGVAAILTGDLARRRSTRTWAPAGATAAAAGVLRSL